MIYDKNPWVKLDSRMIYENPWIRVEEHNVKNPNGGNGIYGKVHFKNKAIGIIPIDKNLNTWLVGQYRYTLDEYSWEIPMGGGPLDDDILISAQRELKEETGISANDWELILRVYLSNSVTDEEGFVYLARNLVFGETSEDETELLKVKKMPFETAFNWAMEGKITDTLSLAGILKAARIIKS
ncbi:NUDIX domain-containing protein [Bacteroidota bacterium]